MDEINTHTTIREFSQKNISCILGTAGPRSGARAGRARLAQGESQGESHRQLGCFFLEEFSKTFTERLGMVNNQPFGSFGVTLLQGL